MRKPRLGSLSLVSILYFVFANTAFADGLHSLWTVKGKQNTVYLLGSMHLLRASEPVPEVMDDAYRDAKTLVMEIDMDDVDPLAGAQTTMRLGVLPAGETLSKQLTPDTAAKLAAYAQRLGIPIAMLETFRPWLAAITLTQLQLMKLGLDPQSGIEQRMVIRAAADHKEILGLETVDEQLGMLANLSPKLQVEFLKQTLAEADQIETEIDKMIVAWRTGDTVALEKFLLDMNESPEISRALVTDRNRSWMTRLDKMLNDKQDYLVIVGAMHLVGKDGLVELLKQRGFKVVQH
jgi:uncharacterized protein YbaP (TraB family)